VDIKKKILRNKRDNILCKTDWLFISDNPVPTKHRVMYKNYRLYLRKFNFDKQETIEKFDNWLRRNEPQLFLDGGDGEEIIKRFFYYL
jgi:hypothetical protein